MIFIHRSETEFSRLFLPLAVMLISIQAQASILRLISLNRAPSLWTLFFRAHMYRYRICEKRAVNLLCLIPIPKS